jgi:hypothetical protein
MRCYGKKITPRVTCMPYHCHIYCIFRFCENFRENENFRETKFRENRPIFAWFSQNWKMHFRFNPTLWCPNVLYISKKKYISATTVPITPLIILYVISKVCGSTLSVQDAHPFSRYMTSMARAQLVRSAELPRPGNWPKAMGKAQLQGTYCQLQPTQKTQKNIVQCRKKVELPLDREYLIEGEYFWIIMHYSKKNRQLNNRITKWAFPSKILFFFCFIA